MTTRLPLSPLTLAGLREQNDELTAKAVSILRVAARIGGLDEWHIARADELGAALVVNLEAQLIRLQGKGWVAA